jgi:hypothetical protein
VGIHLFFGSFAFFGEVKEDVQVVYRTGYSFTAFYPAFQFAYLFHHLFRLLRIVPEIRSLGTHFYFFELYFFTIDVKDTSSERHCVLQLLSVDLLLS